MLYNDSQLAKSERLPKSKIETDSYVAAQLIEKYGKLDFKTIAKMSEAVEGSFVFTILSDKNKLFIAKGDNPLCLIHYKQLGLYVYTSTEDIMKNVLKGSFLEKLPFEVIKVTEGEIISIDKRGRFEKSSFIPNEFCYAGTIMDTESSLMMMTNFSIYVVCSGYRRRILCCFTIWVTRTKR